jgi:hypothetical protein
MLKRTFACLSVLIGLVVVMPRTAWSQDAPRKVRTEKIEPEKKTKVGPGQKGSHRPAAATATTTGSGSEESSQKTGSPTGPVNPRKSGGTQHKTDDE